MAGEPCGRPGESRVWATVGGKVSPAGTDRAAADCIQSQRSPQESGYKQPLSWAGQPLQHKQQPMTVPVRIQSQVFISTQLSSPVLLTSSSCKYHVCHNPIGSVVLEVEGFKGTEVHLRWSWRSYLGLSRQNWSNNLKGQSIKQLKRIAEMPLFLVLTAFMTGFYFMDREVLDHYFLIDTPCCCFCVFNMAMTPTKPLHGRFDWHSDIRLEFPSKHWTALWKATDKCTLAVQCNICTVLISCDCLCLCVSMYGCGNQPLYSSAI